VLCILTVVYVTVTLYGHFVTDIIINLNKVSKNSARGEETFSKCRICNVVSQGIEI